MPGRSWQTDAYKYGYQGSEKDDEISGVDQAHITTFYREGNTRLGRWWGVDPKTNKFAGLSPYSYMNNNPVIYNDITGAEVPTVFKDEKGNETNVIPDQLQKSFNDEYGIKIGYNAETKMLYYDGETKTDKKISESAKKEWMEQLKLGYTSDSKLEFGYNIGRGSLPYRSGGRPEGIQWADTRFKTTYIDLADFQNGNAKGSIAGGGEGFDWDPRSFNLARILEHDFIGHNVKGLSDPKVGSGDSKGDVVRLVNTYEKEMGVLQRAQYYSTVVAKPRIDVVNMKVIGQQIESQTFSNGKISIDFHFYPQDLGKVNNLIEGP